MIKRIWATALAWTLGAFVLIGATSATASTVDYRFSFTSYGGGDVVGVVRGLTEGVNAIDTVEILSHSLGYGVGTYTQNSSYNGAANWTVNGGRVTAWNFMSFGLISSAPDVTDSSLIMSSSYFGRYALAGLTHSANAVYHPRQLVSFEMIAPVPLPATAWLLVAALASVVAFGRRRKLA